MRPVQYLVVFALAGVAGCLAVPDETTEPMCHQDSDCDTANGEVCADGICWGDPPDVLYAARIAAPSNRANLVATEITKIDIADDGWFTTSLRLEAPVVLAGTVNLACGESPCPPIASTVTVTRPSRIPGGPVFAAVAYTTEASGEFSIEVPRANPDEPYSIVIAPDRSNDDGINLDSVAPTRLIVTPTESVDALAVSLGGGGGRVISGIIRDVGGLPLSGVRVVMRGRWEAGGPMTDISSIDVTDASGAFSIRLTDSTVEPMVDLVLDPPTDFELRPVIRLHLDLDDPDEIVTFTYPNLGQTRPLTIPVTGTSTMGVVEPIANAEVTLIAEREYFGLPFAYTAQIEQSKTTSSMGEVDMLVLDGAGLNYELRVQPPPQSGAAQYATIYSSSVDVIGVSTLPVIHLANQVAVHGTLYDYAGRPAEGVVVTVVPNASYAATLSEELQSRLAEAVATSESTHANGEFAVYVDPSIAGAPAVYDINFEPPQHSLLPSWQTRSVTVDPLVGYDLGDFDLPPAAYVRGLVYDPDDELIEGAEVRLYEIPPAIVTCNPAVPAEDPVCAQKAILRALGVSDSGGAVHLVLPDP